MVLQQHLKLQNQRPKKKTEIKKDVLYLKSNGANFADIFYLSKNNIFEQEKYRYNNNNMEDCILSEYQKISKHFDGQFAFVFVTNGKIDTIPEKIQKYENIVIISELQLSTYYGLAFFPQIVCSSWSCKFKNC